MSTGAEEPEGAGAHAWFFDELDDDELAAFDADVGLGTPGLGGVEVTTLDITPGGAGAPVSEPAVTAEPATMSGSAEPDTMSGSAGSAGPPTPTDDADARRSRPGRLMLGLAVLAAERLRPGPPADAFLAGVGLVQQSADGARTIARRAIRRPARFASRAATVAAWLPGAEASRRRLSRSAQRLNRIVLDARLRGAATVAAGRADAAGFVQHTVSDGLAWAQARAVPQIVNGLVPQLVDEVVPRIIDGALPEIRERVLPVVIEDLTTDPQVRELVREQGLGVVGEAADHLRATTSTADDRIESAFRRLVRSPQPEDPSAPGGPPGADPRPE